LLFTPGVRDGTASPAGSPRRRRTDGARILVVEDHDDFRLLLEVTLQHAGYVVASAPSSEDAIAMLAESAYDLLVVDYSLPGHSGAWLLAQARGIDARHDVPSLMITGDPDAPGIPGDVTVIRKPIAFDQMLARVRAILANTSTKHRRAGHVGEHARAATRSTEAGLS
jgi:DNA-binding response OmpR family regulator